MHDLRVGDEAWYLKLGDIVSTTDDSVDGEGVGKRFLGGRMETVGDVGEAALSKI